MDHRKLLDNLRKEVNVALTKVFDEVGKATKVSGHRLAINSLKGEIRENKEKLGSIICEHEELSNQPELKDIVLKIKALHAEIEEREEQIRHMKEKETEAEEEAAMDEEDEDEKNS